MKKITAAFALLTLLAACSSEPTSRVKVDMNVGTKINLDVQAVTFADRSGIQPANSPYNTQRFQPTIAEAIKQWASDKLQATGTAGDAIIIVKDASLVAEALPHGNDWFTRQQTSKYSAHAEVDIEVKGRAGAYAIASAQASRFETLPENPTEAERQNAYANLLNGLMRDLGQAIQSSINQHLRQFVVNAPR